MNIKILNIFRVLVLAHLLNISQATADEAHWVVSGKVLNKINKQPIFGATVSIREMDTINTLTDEVGHFQLNIPSPGNYSVIATMLGAENPIIKTIILDSDNKKIKISLLMAMTTYLPEIVVSAERNSNRVGKLVIKGTEIRKLAGSSGDPLRSLQSLPGVTSSNGSSAPAVRGSGPGDNFYYADGIPVGKLFHYGGISIFNGDLIEDFNLYSAAFAPNYDNVTGAILDVSLRNPRTDRIGGKVNISLTGADFLVEGPVTENQSWYIAARRSYFDLLIKKIERNGVALQVPNYWDYQGKYVWKINDDNSVAIHANAAADSLRLEIANTAEIAQTQPDLAGSISAQDSATTQALVWDSKIIPDMSSKLIIGHRNSHSENYIASAGNVLLNVSNSYIRELLRFVPFANHDISLGSNFNHSQIGMDLDFKNTNCTQFNTGCDLSSASKIQLKESIQVQSWDFSVQDRWRFAKQFIFIGGMRHSKENYLNQSDTEPRLGLEWEWSEKTLLSAGWGKHNQLPSGQQIAKNFGNPNLLHIHAEHSVLGMTHTVDENWTWKTETYYKKFNNLVVGVNDPAINYVNGASGSAYGVELLIKKEAIEEMSGWLSITLARSERRNDLTGESFRFEYDQPINVTWITNYKLSDNWSMGTKWTYTSGRPYTPVIGTNGVYPDGRPKPVYAPINSGTLPDYHRLDLRFDRHFDYEFWNLNFYVELNNAYFRKNIVGYNYGPNYDRQDPIEAFVFPLSFGIQGEF